MTTSTPDQAADRTISTLLRLRTDTAARVALRRGGSDATAHYAYPYLAHHWTNEQSRWKRLPLLRFAALLATAANRPNDPTVTVGQFLRRTALANATGGSRDAIDRALDRVGQRALWVQSGDVTTLDQMLRGLIPTSPAPGGISWQSVHDTYLWWDQPDLERRRIHRRRLLEDLYTPTRTTDIADTTDDEKD